MLLTEKLLHTTAAYIKKLKEIGIETVPDLLAYYPRDYEDRSVTRTFSTAVAKELNVIPARVESVETTRTFSGKQITTVLLSDTDQNPGQAVWFNQQYFTNKLQAGKQYLFSGKGTVRYGTFVLSAPDIESMEDSQKSPSRIIAIYPEVDTEKKYGVRLTSDWFFNKMALVKPNIKSIPEFLPTQILKKENLLALSEALTEIHFPSSFERLHQARKRLAFNELFLLQLSALQKRYHYQHSNEALGKKIPTATEVIKEFLTFLPFSLTNDQKITLYQCLKDMEKGFPMMRLLQGDVGSGKTAVAAALAYHVIRAGFQVAFMVPTEVLAQQHFKSLSEIFASTNIPITLLTGSTSEKEKKEIYMGLSGQKSEVRSQKKIHLAKVDSSEPFGSEQEDVPDSSTLNFALSTINFIVGTHALIQEKVEFKNLGLVIIDEQHRFGVEQRKKLASFGYPHVLHMTATPIPRTLALTIYGDQDISLIKELPSGRTPIITSVVAKDQIHIAYALIASEIEKGRQAYIICPLIEASDLSPEALAKGGTLQYKSVADTYTEISNSILGRYTIEVLHGKLKPDQKNRVMESFVDGVTQILVSTTVIEVGISVENATIMTIIGADRFGLSQLHQLRGRVGRGAKQSYCLLISEVDSPKALERLRLLEQTNSGFDIAEKDLAFRGAGEIYGLRQSGIMDFKIADLSDIRFIEYVRAIAEELIAEDPELKKYPLLKDKISIREVEIMA